jgi:predicted nuclease of restriction endonuclease-like (RecB) superfamily
VRRFLPSNHEDEGNVVSLLTGGSNGMRQEGSMTKNPTKPDIRLDEHYDFILGDISNVIDVARRSAARSVNSIMTAAYWLIGRRIVELEQKGEKRAAYGEELLERLSADLGKRYGRGFSRQNLQQMRQFYLLYLPEQIFQTPSGESRLPLNAMICQTPSGILQTPPAELSLGNIASRFPLPWSGYVRLLTVKNENARRFYEAEALRGGWSVRQLDRQINSQFYERAALSKNKAAVLTKGQKALPEDRVLPEEEIKDPFVLEFLGLKDEYSETDLEAALIRHLETFLLELGGDFCFIGRQKRLRIGEEWYRVDLVFFHRRLRCLVIIELKIGRFTHADAGQMHLYLNYAREHWVREGENPPVGLILCAQKDEAVARYALEGLPNKVMASEYRTALPDEKELAAEIERTQVLLQERKMSARTSRDTIQTKKSEKTRGPLDGRKGAAKGS